MLVSSSWLLGACVCTGQHLRVCLHSMTLKADACLTQRETGDEWDMSIT